MPRVIRDAVHGYVELCPVQECILGTKTFQRLRYVRQNDVGYLTYPGLTQTRFEHSLGTSCFARKLFRAVIENDGDGSARDRIISETREAVPGISRWPEKAVLDHVEKALVLFGMVHDIGHLPFSHLTETALAGLEEGVYDNWEESDNFGPLHEFAGYLILSSNRQVRSALRICKMTRFSEVIGGIFKKDEAAPPISRTLKAFLSSDVDADRLDYLIRDGKSVGDEWGRFDIDRIMLNLRLVPKAGRLRLVPRLQATSAIEAFLCERYRQYQWVHFHHRSVFFGAAFSRMLHCCLKYANGERPLVPLRLFNCGNYAGARGFFDDSELWNRLVRRDVSRMIQPERRPLVRALRRSLLFRETRSVSLWKRSHAYTDFCDAVEPELTRCVTRHWSAEHDESLPAGAADKAFAEERLLNAFARSPEFGSDPLSFLKFEEQYVNSDDSDVYVLLGRPHFAPFKTRREKGLGEICDVFLWDESSGKFDPVTDVSHLVRSLQAGWRRGIGLFAFAVDLTGGPLTEERKSAMLERGTQMLRNGLEAWFREQASVAQLLSR